MKNQTATTSFRRRSDTAASIIRHSNAATIGRRVIAAAAVLLLTANGASAATKFQTNLVPSVPDCLSFYGTCINVEGSCGFDNNECAGGTVSPKSKVKIDGSLALKATILGVTDVLGNPLTTSADPNDASALILKVSLSNCMPDTGSPPICDDTTHTLYAKVTLNNGVGAVTADLSAALASISPGGTIAVLGVSLLSPSTGSCPGDNSAAAIAARMNNGVCENTQVPLTIVRAVGGILAP